MHRLMRRHLPLAMAAVTVAPSALANDNPTSVRLYRSATVVDADGRMVQISKFEIAVANDAAARREAQRPMTYTEGAELVEFVEGYTLKPNGQRIPLTGQAIRTQLAPGTPSLPQYAARRQIVAVFPNVAGGDVLSITWRRTILQPIIHGQFFATYLFSRSVPWEDAEVLISLPAEMTLLAEAHGPEHSEAIEDGRRVHRWRWSAPAGRSPTVLSALDHTPRIFASTIPDWPAFSRVYAALVMPRAEVTPRVQALAAEIVAGAADLREEAQRLYEWVAQRVRWVAIYVGDGAFVPHTAATVLENGYGDCKDQVTLLTALLRARGIAAEPVLVNLGPTYRLSGPPTLTAFNHMITYLPRWGVYVDTTAREAAFGTLPMSLYGKPILHVTEAGAAPTRLPALPPNVATTRHVTTMRLDPEGRISGESVTEAAGPFATSLRQLAGSVLAQGTERAAAERLRALGFSGTGQVRPAPLDGPIGPSYRLEGRFTLNPRPGLLEGDSFAPPSGLRYLARPGDGLISPLGLPRLAASETTPCYAGKQEEELRLELPPGYRPARLPRSRRIEERDFTYESHWSFEEGVLRVVRHFVSVINQPLCTGLLRSTTARAVEEIRRDLDAQVELARDR